MDAKDYIKQYKAWKNATLTGTKYQSQIIFELDKPDRNGRIWNKKAVEKAMKKYKRQQKLRKIKNWIVIFIVAAVFLLFSYGVFGLIVDVLPQLVK